MKLHVSTKTALGIFIFLVLFVIAQATWWVILMAELQDEKVTMAGELGATSSFLEKLHQEEISRQIMLGTEGVFFLLLLLVGIWVIYKTLVRTEMLKRRQDNFLMAVTHEFKTPLASMKLYLDTLQSEKISADQKLKVIPRIKEDIFRLERLVNDVLDAGRFEKSVYHGERKTINLSWLLTTIADEFKIKPATAPIELTQKIKPGIFICGDTIAIRRGIEAILDNTLKYHNGYSIHVNISLTQFDGNIIVKISDQGIGLKQDECEAVFDRFYRVGNELTRTSSGTGLGLYLCREMIQANGGTVVVKSKGLGKGVEFMITFPVELKSDDCQDNDRDAK